MKLEDLHRKTLHQLALRNGHIFVKNDTKMEWLTGEYDPYLNVLVYKCCICNVNLYETMLDAHGILHIKEHNLLAFL